MLTKDQIAEWEDSMSYYEPGPQPTVKPQTLDPYDDAPVVDDAYKQDFSKTSGVMSMVKQFSKVTGQQPSPSLYVKLIGEEIDEWTKEGMVRRENDLKELADLVYVLYGYANAMKYDLDEAIHRVHKNNLGRCVQPDGSVKRRSDGKIIRNKDYPKVELGDLI